MKQMSWLDFWVGLVVVVAVSSCFPQVHWVFHFLFGVLTGFITQEFQPIAALTKRNK